MKLLLRGLVRVDVYGRRTWDRGFLGERMLDRPFFVDGLRARAFHWPPCDVPGCAASANPSLSFAHRFSRVDRVSRVLETGGAEAVRLHREEYPASGSLAEVRRLMSRCTGVVIVGVAQLLVANGRLRPGTPEEAAVSDLALSTPWNHVEAGMAFALDLPVLVVHEQVGDMGVFGLRNETSTLTLLDVRRAGIEKLDEAVESWLRTLSSF